MIWKKIDGFDYEVSYCGKVRSIAKIIIRSNGKSHTVKSKILRSAIDDGYEKVALSGSGKLRTFRVHRLVANAFCIKKENDTEVNHIDGNKLNNNADNLEWTTRKGNMRHAFDTGLAKVFIGSGHHSAKIDEIKALVIKTMLLSGFSQKEILKQYNISKYIVQDISRGKTWTHIL